MIKKYKLNNLKNLGIVAGVIILAIIGARLFFASHASQIPGDANGDGVVNISDLAILAAHYGVSSGATWAEGDFNGDGAVNVADLSILASHWGNTGGSCIPAAFPSRLKTSGRSIVDSNGCTMPLMKGFSMQTGSNFWNTSNVNAMAAKGVTYVRVVLFWNQFVDTNCSAFSTASGDGTAYVADIDAQIAANQAAGIYTELELDMAAAPHDPACGSTGLSGAAASDEFDQYMQNGQWITQYLANRYGNPSSPEYTNDVVGFGLNEPPPPSAATDTNWNTLMAQDQSTMLTWIRGTNGVGGDAPEWIGIVSGGPWGYSTPIYNANPGQTNQCTNCANTSLTAYASVGGNIIVDLHFYMMGCNSSWTGAASACDGRASSGGPSNASDGGWLVGTGDSNNPAYPISGETEATAKEQLANYLYPYTLYSQEANVPLMIGEFGWYATINTTGAVNYANDLMSTFATASPVVEMEWDYDVTQSQDGWAVHPGVGATGANSDGWQTFTDAWI
jgi:hypothetical protein